LINYIKFSYNFYNTAYKKSLIFSVQHQYFIRSRYSNQRTVAASM